jgi:hypothetical protein
MVMTALSVCLNLKLQTCCPQISEQTAARERELNASGGFVERVAMKEGIVEDERA